MRGKSDIQFGRCRCGNMVFGSIKKGDKCKYCGSVFTHDYEGQEIITISTVDDDTKVKGNGTIE